MDIVLIGIAFFFGWLFTKCGLPSLIGFLLSGFFINVGIEFNYLQLQHPEWMLEVAHIGILLLLFSVGLKTEVSKIVKLSVVGPGVLHFIAAFSLAYPILHYLFGFTAEESISLAALFTFSSTVLAGKILEDRHEIRSLHGQITIGILILQDLFAMAVLSVESGSIPPWYSALVLLLPFAKPLFMKLINQAGHGDLLILAGVVLAVGGGALFHTLGFSGELGALVFGVLCARSERVKELNESIASLKEIFLVVFFLTIGLSGLPTVSDFYLAVAMVLMLPAQCFLWFLFLRGFKVPQYDSFLIAVSLSTFSEFALIVASATDHPNQVSIALAVAMSFLVATPLNTHAPVLFRWIFNPKNTSEMTSKTLSSSDLIIVGMGKLGRAAYRAAKNASISVIGVDSNVDDLERLTNEGFVVLGQDSESPFFWSPLAGMNAKAVIITLESQDSSIATIENLREAGFTGTIIVHTKYHYDEERFKEAGADRCHFTFEYAGQSLISGLV